MERYVTLKEAKKLLSSFMMSHNCYREFIKCYKYAHQDDHEKNYTASEIFDSVAIKVYKKNTNIGETLNKISISFHWGSMQKVLCPMHGKEYDTDYCYEYWNKVSEKLQEMYCKTYITNS